MASLIPTTYWIACARCGAGIGYVVGDRRDRVQRARWVGQGCDHFPEHSVGRRVEPAQLRSFVAAGEASYVTRERVW